MTPTSFGSGAGQDTVIDYATEADNIDTIKIAGLMPSQVTLSRDIVAGNDLLIAVAGTNDQLRVQDQFSGDSYAIEQIVFDDGTVWDRATMAAKLTYNGTAGDDYMSGIYGYVNRINGLGGNDTIYGADKDDVLDGGTESDVLTGRAGNDTYVVDNIGDTITENLDEGTDTVTSTITYTLGANLENLTLTGTAAINGTGNALANTLTGNAGNNMLDGGAGADTMIGGAGNDTYVVDDAGDVVTEAGRRKAPTRCRARSATRWAPTSRT